MPVTPRPAPRSGPAAGLVLASVVSVQFGGAWAATLISTVGVLGSVALRITLAAVVLLALARPSLRGRSRGDWVSVVMFGVALAAMNAAFYGALARLPLGVAVTIEFLGPLTLAAVLSRRARDVGAAGAALAGVVLVSRVAHGTVDRLDLLGVALALVAGACWAWYILASRHAGRRWEGLDGIAVAMGVAALLTGPLGVLDAGEALLAPGTLVRGAGIALLSSAVPYSLEFLALRTLSAEVFGILMSIEPAMAALAGALVLHQVIGLDQVAGMALVIAASVIVMRAPSQARAPSRPLASAGRDDTAPQCRSPRSS